jgi:hypothetical protein
MNVADSAVFAAATQGFRQGAGPFWDAMQLCGRPLFGVWGQPWSSPLAPLLLLAGPWALAVCSVLGMALVLKKGPRRPWSFGFALLSQAGLLFMPLGFKAGLAVAPWALMAFWDAPFAAAVLCLALLVSTLSPGLLAAVLVLSYWQRAERQRSRIDWLKRVAWAAGLALPACLPLLFKDTQVMELGRAWPVAAPSEWAMAASWAACALVLGALPSSSMAGKAAVAGLGLVLAMGACTAPVYGPGNRHSPIINLPYNRIFSRYLDASGDVRALAAAAGNDVSGLLLVGSVDGRGSLASLRRWQHLSFEGSQDAPLLSLANVGWLASNAGAGAHGNRPVGVAMVDQAQSWHDPAPTALGPDLFDRPLLVEGNLASLQSPQAGDWHLLNASGSPAASSTLNVATGHQAVWIFFSQSYDFGWQARLQSLDGSWRKAKILRSQGDFLAFPIEPGVDKVVLDYRPPFFSLCLLLSASLLAFLGWQQRGFLFDGR